MNRFYEDLIRQMEQEFERNDEMLRRFLHSFTSPERFWEPRADIYETREKKSKMYFLWAFVTGLIVSEIAYLCICAAFYFTCW